MIPGAFGSEAQEQIQGFTTEAEAARWIRNESVAWVHARRHDKGRQQGRQLRRPT